MNLDSSSRRDTDTVCIGGVGNNELWKCQSDIRLKCAQKRYINTCERKKESHHIIYSRATPLIYIVRNRDKEEEEEARVG